MLQQTIDLAAEQFATGSASARAPPDADDGFPVFGSPHRRHGRPE